MASKSAQNDLPSESNTYNNDVLRIVIVGKTGVGKSATGNTLVEKEFFKSKFSFKSLTVDCSNAFGEVDGQRVKVIATPGLCDTKIDEEKTRKDVPGPHIFLVVIRWGRFTDEEKQTVKKNPEIFREDADMVLFAHGDVLKGKPIEEFLNECEDLKELKAKYRNIWPQVLWQYHVFNNEVKDRSQVGELLDKIRNITKDNGGGDYTNEMFQEAEMKLEEAKHCILEERKEEIRKQEKEIQKGLDKKEQLKKKKNRERLEVHEREMEERRRKREKQEKKKERSPQKRRENEHKKRGGKRGQE